MKLRATFLLHVVVVTGTVGHPVLATVMSAVGISSSAPAIAMRSLGLLAAVSLLAFFARANTGKITLVHLSLILFWLIYLIRMTHDTLFQGIDLAVTGSRYWIFAIGVGFVPMLSLIFYNGELQLGRLFRVLLALSLFGVTLALLLADTQRMTESGILVDIGRMELDKLNPISLGHFSGSLALLSYWALRSLRWNTAALILFVFALGIGMYGVLLSASRGPLISVASCFLLFELSQKKLSVFISGAIVVVLLQLIAFDLASLDVFLGTNTFERLANFFQLSDAASQSRLALLPIALKQFAAHPVFGDLIEVRGLANYPHNLFVESLMATGLAGTLPLGIAIFLATRSAFKMLSQSDRNSWVALLFIQQLLASQTSGAIYTSGALWVTLALLATITSAEIKRKNANKVLRL